MDHAFSMRYASSRIFPALLCVGVLASSFSFAGDKNRVMLRFQISFPTSVSNAPLTGRMFLAISRADTIEPRLRVGRYGVQLFGSDFDQLKPDSPVTIDETTLGYPVENLKELPPGDYTVQAVLSKYTKFERADGHTVWMHMDGWEGQDWRRSPGNVVSEVRKLTVREGQNGTVKMEVI